MQKVSASDRTSHNRLLHLCYTFEIVVSLYSQYLAIQEQNILWNAYAAYERIANEAAPEHERKFPNSCHPSEKFISQLVQRVNATANFRIVERPSRFTLYSTDDETGILCTFT